MARLARRRKATTKLEPYSHTPHIQVSYEYRFSPRKLAEPGDELRFGGVPGSYGKRFIFKMVATNTKTGSVWIDCIDADTNEFRSFAVQYLKDVKKAGKLASRASR